MPSIKIRNDTITINVASVTKWRFKENDGKLKLKKEITILEIIKYIVIGIIDVIIGILLFFPEIDLKKTLLLIVIIILEYLFFNFFDYTLPFILLRDEYMKILDK